MAGSLVGRQKEQHAVTEALRAGAEGRGSVFAVSGEAGIGKTTLVTAMAAAAAEDGFAVLRGHCYEAGGAPAYWPWIEILRSIANWVTPSELEARLGSRRTALAALVPELVGVPADEQGAGDSDEARFLLFDGVMTVLGVAAQRSPLLVVIEDVHAADVPTLLLLDFVARRAPGQPIVIVFTYREVEARLNPSVDEALSRIAVSQLALRSLGPGEIAELVGAGGEEAERVHQLSNGNPLIAHEVSGLIRDGAVGRVPTSARAMFARRLDMLDADARETVLAAAVLGVEFDVALVAEVTALPLEHVLKGLATGMRAGVLAEAEFPGATSRFRHALIRDAIYESLDPSERAKRHAAAASALQRRGPGKASSGPAALAQHALQAVPVSGWRPAVAGALGAAEAAMRLLAFEDAVRVLTDALAVVPLGEEEARLGLLLDFATACALSRYQDEAQAAFEEAEAIARRTDNVDALVRVALGGGAAPMRTFGLPGVADERLIGLLEEVLERLPVTEDALRARVMTRLAGHLWWVPGAHHRRDALTRQAAEIARRIDDPRLLSRALYARYATMVLPPAESDAVANEAAAAFRRCADLPSRAQGDMVKVQEALSRGDMATARAAMTSAVSAYEQYGIPIEIWYARCYSLVFPLIEGRFDEAEEMLAAQSKLAEKSGLGERASFLIEIVRVMIVRRRFRIEDLTGLGDLMYALVAAYPGMSPWLPATAVVFGWLGDERGSALVRQALDNLESTPREFNWLSSMLILADAMAVTGVTDGAEVVHGLLSPYEGRTALVSTIDVYGPVDRGLATLEAMMGRWEDSERHFESALAMDGRMRARPSLVQTRLHYAQMLGTRGRPGDSARATELVEAALRDGADLGMDDLATIASTAFGLEIEAGGARSPETGRGEPASVDAGPAAVFRREGDIWSVTFAGSTFSVRDSKGMQQLARLVATPGTEVHVLELAGGPRTELEQATVAAGAQSAGAALDERSKAEYRRRVTELQEEIDDAEDCADLGRASKAREELQFLLDELAGAVGLGGRDRPAASSAERARVAVTKTVRAAIDRIADHDQRLGDHLRSAVSTGVFCSYRPDPMTSTRLTVET